MSIRSTKNAMNIGNSLAVRSAAIAASFLLALIIATFATGCASGGSSGGQSASGKLCNRPGSS